MKIQLNVPFFSQRENNVIWDDKYDQNVAGFPLGAIQYRSCNITCLTMILHYYSIIDLTPDQLLERIRNKNDAIHSLYTEPSPIEINLELKNYEKMNFLNVWGTNIQYKENDFSLFEEPTNLVRIASFIYEEKKLEDISHKIRIQVYFGLHHQLVNQENLFQVMPYHLKKQKTCS